MYDEVKSRVNVRNAIKKLKTPIKCHNIYFSESVFAILRVVLALVFIYCKHSTSDNVLDQLYSHILIFMYFVRYLTHRKMFHITSVDLNDSNS
jgi:hypothetical protein